MCKAITKKGTQCKNMGLYNGACHLHATDNDRVEQRLQNSQVPPLQSSHYSLRTKQLVDAKITLLPKPAAAIKPITKKRTTYTTYIYISNKPKKPQPTEFNGLDGADIDITDRQNVHRTAINAKMLDATNFLIKKYPIGNINKECNKCMDEIHMLYSIRNTEILDKPEPEHSITKTYNLCFFKYTRVISTPKQYVKQRIDQWNEFINIYSNNSFYNTKPKIFLLVLYHILSFQNNKIVINLLINRLVEEVIDGKNVCAHGKTARLINIFSGIDKTIGNDNRSTGEIIQDKMAEISKLDPNLREKAATEFFKNIDITDAEKQVWIDALLD